MVKCILSSFCFSLGVYLGIGVSPAKAMAAEREAFAPEPVKGLLLRADLSLAPGAYVQHVSNTAGDQADASAASLGPRLGLNLGFAPSRLIRLGLSISTDFSLNVVEDQGLPDIELDGWVRWILGPTVGFRFGPSVPLELELGAGFSHMIVIGSQALVDEGGSLAYQVGDQQFGPAGSALLVYRPGGADSIWGLHAGLLGGWGHAQHSPRRGSTTFADAFTGSLLLGLSAGF